MFKCTIYQWQWPVLLHQSVCTLHTPAKRNINKMLANGFAIRNTIASWRPVQLSNANLQCWSRQSQFISIGRSNLGCIRSHFNWLRIVFFLFFYFGFCLLLSRFLNYFFFSTSKFLVFKSIVVVWWAQNMQLIRTKTIITTNNWSYQLNTGKL